MIFRTEDGEMLDHQVRFPLSKSFSLNQVAFGEIDGYGVSLHVSVPEAIKLWGYPVDPSDISKIFQRHVCGELNAMPWSEETLNPETMSIKDELCKLIGKGWWTVASQPAVNGIR